MRIVSLVPCITETVAALGAAEQLVGVTRYCVSPSDLPDHVARVGGVRDPDLERIRGLTPDLVLVDREENRAEDAQALATHCAVLVSEVSTVARAADFVDELGGRIAREEAAGRLARTIRALPAAPAPRGRAAVVLWPDPLVLAGPGTYVGDVLRRLGWEVWAPGGDRYPRPAVAELAAGNPGLVVLPTEPYAFTEAHAAVWERLVAGARAVVVPGEDLCWYGARTPAALRRLGSFPTIGADHDTTL